MRIRVKTDANGANPRVLDAESGQPVENVAGCHIMMVAGQVPVANLTVLNPVIEFTAEARADSPLAVDKQGRRWLCARYMAAQVRRSGDKTADGSVFTMRFTNKLLREWETADKTATPPQPALPGEEQGR